MEKQERDKMPMLHNGQNNTPKAEQSSPLCSNDDVGDCSALGTKEPPIEVLIDQFAEILVKAYFYEKRKTR